MASEYLERETKYDAAPEVVLSDLTGLVPAGGRIARESLRLDSVYSTPNPRPAEPGVTLRCRTGTTDKGWQLMVPSGNARTEIRLDLTGSQTTVPKELSLLVAGIRRGKALRHMVTSAPTAPRTVFSTPPANGGRDRR